MSLLTEITIKKIGLPQRFCETKDLWEKVEEPKRVQWTKQRGDESAAVEKLSKRFTQIFRVPQTEEQAEKSCSDVYLHLMIDTMHLSGATGANN